MEWVDGYSLRDFIKQNLGQPNLLRAAADKFCETAEALQKVHAAHGDLQAENMILRVSNGTVHYKLIDYDTLVVPGLLGKPINSTGLAAYQHPLRQGSTTATEKDDFFSELVIYLCLRAVAEDSSVWSKFPATGRDKELLFQGADYRSNVPTALFRQLYDMGGLVQKLAVILWNFSRCHSINQLVPLERALELATEVKATESEAKPPRNDFERYLKSKLDERRSSLGLPNSWLDDCAFRSGTTGPSAQTPSTGSIAKG
jgi:serine/threonine protein kinase